MLTAEEAERSRIAANTRDREARARDHAQRVARARRDVANTFTIAQPATIPLSTPPTAMLTDSQFAGLMAVVAPQSKPQQPKVQPTPENAAASARVLAARFDGEQSKSATATPAAKRVLAALLG